MEQIISSPKWFGLNFVPCPSCNAQMMPKPVTGEWNNVFCTSCDFACRYIVTPNSPEDKILATKKADLEDLLQLKKALSPLMIHFKWTASGINRERIVFWPFIAYRFLKEEHRHLISLKPDEQTDVVVFGNMFELPTITLYESPSDEEIAEEISQTWKWPIHTARIQIQFETGYAHAARIKDLAIERLRKLGRLGPEENEDENEEL